MIIGIDLGTTNSLVAVWDKGEAKLVPNVHGENLTPSVVGIDDNGDILIGASAKERLLSHPLLTHAHFKLSMGTDKKFKLGKQKYRAEELSALIIKQLKKDVEEYFGVEVEEAIISVPAYFNNIQRDATKTAGKLAGLKVERIINEPSAASLAYGLHDRGKESTFMIFDLGGGTFDVSIIEISNGIMEIRSSTGNNHLGGEDFTQVLLKMIVQKCDLFELLNSNKSKDTLKPLLRKKAEDIKIKLTEEKLVKVSFYHLDKLYECTITDLDFKSESKELLDKLRMPIERAMRDISVTADDLDAIILVGGGTKMPIVKSFVASSFGKLPYSFLNPDEIVGLGAAIQAGLKCRDKALSDIVVTDVCPYTLGTAMIFNSNSNVESFKPIIERNTVIPVSKVITGYNVSDGQRIIEIKIYQGENMDPKENILLGHLDIQIPSGKAGQIALDVRYTYDINGLLEVETFIQKTQEKQKLIINNSNTNMSDKEITECFKRLDKLKIHPRDQDINRLLIARAERIYTEVIGDARYYITNYLHEFNECLNSQDTRIIISAQERFEEILNEFEVEEGLV